MESEDGLVDQRAAAHAGRTPNPSTLFPEENPACASICLSGSTFRLLLTGVITRNLLIVGGEKMAKCSMCVDLMGSLGALMFTLYHVYKPRVTEDIAARLPADL